jgi:hypothetical protein
MDEKELAEKVMGETAQTVEVLPTRTKVTIAILTMALLFLGGYLIYEYFFTKPQLVTYQSQQQAETSQGVKEAANNAHVDMLQSQLDETAKQIVALKNKAPDTITHTVVQQVPVIVEKEREKSGADFAIVTNPKNSDQKIDLSQHKENDPVVLNQYNVHAYKKILRQIDYAPKNVDNWTPAEVGYSVSRKISNDGKYLGVAVDHNFDDKKTIVKLRYTY